MSFGKRPPGQRPDIRKVLLEVSTKAKAEAASVVVEEPAANTTQSKPVKFDGPERKTARAAKSRGKSGDGAFLALALGVMVVSGGAAFAAPEVISWAQANVFGTPVRPIATVIAGLDKTAAKAALAREAFPDADGKAFMTALATDYPADHSKLLDRMTDVAMKGGDRKDMSLAMSEWVLTFMPANLDSMSRAGSKGFDKTLDFGTEVLGVLEKATNGSCTAASLQALATDPTVVERFSGYGSDGYKLGAHAARLLVDIAAEGRNAAKIQARLLPEDNTALQATMMSLMQDPQVMGLVQMSAQAAMSGKAPNFNPAAANNLNVCKLGRVAIGKLKLLPDDTKARLWATGFASMDAAGLTAKLKQAQGSLPGA